MKRYNVAVVVDSSSAFSQGVLRGITQYVLENGPWNIAYEERSLDSHRPEWLESWHGDGIIIRTRTSAASMLVLTTHAQVVDLGEEPLPNTPLIGINHQACSRMAAELLRQRQFMNFAYVGIRQRPFSAYRLKEFRRLLGKDIPSYEIPLTCLCTIPTRKISALASWLKALPKPCGLMACNDLAGNFVIQTCVSANILVPDEIAVIGVDNDAVYCQMSPVPMSSIELDTHRMGLEAAALLHRLMAGESPPEKPYEISPLKLIERQSTDSLAVTDTLVRKALIIMREEACEGLNILDLVKRLGVSRRYLERRFTVVLHSSIYQEILRIQMLRAQELLIGTSLTLNSISRRTGFKNASHFCTVFKRWFKKTPGDFRSGRE